MKSTESTCTENVPRFRLLPVRRWYLVALIFLVALINYFDRQSLSVVAPRFQALFHLSDKGYGHIVSMFLLASAFSYAIAGILTDWLGTRASMAVFVGWWSVAEAATAIVRTAGQLAAARFCLGLGEPGLWVSAPKAVGEILPKKDHSLAIGVYTLGSTVGAVIALPAIAAIVAHLQWKIVFIIDGAAGLLWLPLWLSAYPSVRKSTSEQVMRPAVARPSMRAVLANSATWRFLIARGLTDPIWYFFLFWFPKYMFSTRHLTLAHLARVGWLVYLFAGAGTLLGGFASNRLIRRGHSPAQTYRRVMFCCAALLPLSPLVATLPNVMASVLIASVIALAHMAWLVTLSASIIHLFPPSQLGTAFGLIAAGSGFGGMISTEIIGHVVMAHGYLPLFFAMMFLHPIALALLWSALREQDEEKSA